jgi:hypothetical protein
MRTDGNISSKLAKAFAESCIEAGKSLIHKTAQPLPTDPWEFLIRCCFTYDERAKEHDLPDIRQFPAKRHLEILTREWQAHPFLAVDKSSQIVVTWWLAGVTLWQVLLSPAQRVAWFCLKRSLAADHLESRILRLYQLIPAEFQKPHAEIIGGEFLVFHDGAEKLPTSRIVPMAAETESAEDAAKQMRSETWTAAVEDESCFYRNGEELHFSLLPRTGRLTKVSTPNGWSFTSRLMYAADLSNPVSPEATVQPVQLAHGIDAWDRHGFRCLRINFRADPEKDPDTPTGRAWYNSPALVALRQDNRKWRREMENDHSVPAGEPVYANTDRIVAEFQGYRCRLKLFRCWDFGHGTPVCIFKQVEPVEDGNGKVIRKIVRVIKEFTGHNTDIATFYEDTIKPFMEENFSWATYANNKLEDFGDPAGNAKEGTSGKSAIEVLRALGVIVKSSSFKLEETRLDREAGRIDILQQIISAGDLHIDPQECPGLLADLRGRYHRDDFGKIVKDGEHDHRPDALGYGVGCLFRFDTQLFSGGNRVLNGPDLPSAQPRPKPRTDPNAHPASLINMPPAFGSGMRKPVEILEHTKRVYAPNPRYDPRERLSTWRRR